MRRSKETLRETQAGWRCTERQLGRPPVTSLLSKELTIFSCWMFCIPCAGNTDTHRAKAGRQPRKPVSLGWPDLRPGSLCWRPPEPVRPMDSQAGVEPHFGVGSHSCLAASLVMASLCSTIRPHAALIPDIWITLHSFHNCVRALI